MSNISNSVLLQQPEYSTHNLTEELKTTTHIGRITPIYCQEVVPGDSVDINGEFLTKFQPMVTPALQNFNAYIHYFYVPMRILWRNWKYFIHNVPAPGSTNVPIAPYIDLSLEPAGKFTAPAWNFLYNYFGLQSSANTQAVNALPFAAYQLIYNEYFRHEKIHTDNREDLYLTDGNNAAILSILEKVRYRTYKDDYFTAALTAPQSGQEASVALVTNNMLPVLKNPIDPGVDTGDTDATSNLFLTNNPSTNLSGIFINYQATTDPNINQAEMYVDPNNATFTLTQNEIIELNRMQEFLVRQNLAGNRYNEYILAFFGVRVPDLRLDRPDYITGVKAPVTISEVLNTAASQGTQTGQGNAYAEGGKKNYKVLEHGLIIGVYTCMPEKAYMNAISRLLWKLSYEDYYIPIFDQMGEREIINKEIVQDHTNPYGTFGYIPKYAEYRLPFNKVTGQFASNLDTWHLAMDLPNTVTLNDQFFDVENPSRCFVVTNPQTADAILLWIVNQVYINRPMKKYSMPVLTNSYGNNIS